MNNHPTSNELYLMFMESYAAVLEELNKELKFRKKNKQNTEMAMLHYTLKIIQRYFNQRGGLPV